MALEKAAVDPITFEVIKHRLWQINDEQGATIRSLSTSPIVVEGNDFNTGLFTKDGDLAVAGPNILLHVTTMDAIIQNVMDRVEDVVDGDVFLVNDPALGVLHQNDAAVLTPVFCDGEIAMWAGNVLHYPDVGGMDAGSFCINATEIFQEAPRYFMRIVRAGKLDRELEYTFVINSRLPESVALDLRAQIGALNVGRDRLTALLQEYGRETVQYVMSRSIDYTERRLRERLRELPDGSWSTDVYMDGDRMGSERIIRVHLTLTKEGDHLLFDYEGSDEQSLGPCNATLYTTFAAAASPLYAFLCGGELDWNSSVRRCIDVRAPEGTVMNARYPAAVSICSTGFTWLAAVASTRVVADMLAASERFRDRATPSWGVSCNANNFFAKDRNGKLVGALLSDHRGAGAGARFFADGFDHAGNVFSALSFMSNVEGQEWKLPVMYLFRRQLTDSGGLGEHRGGLTVISALTPYGTDDILWKSTNTAGSNQSNAAGMAGGYPGAGSQVTVVRGTSIWEGLAAGRMPSSYGGLDGTVEHLPTKSEGHLATGDVFVFYPPGGGGSGDPLSRDPAQVRVDVSRGAVSQESALRHYGVVLDANLDVDEAATGQERSRRISARRDGTARETLSSPPASALRCDRCGGDEAGATTTWVTSLREAGPWLAERWSGESPDFGLLHTACAVCGGLLDVREVRTQVPA